MQRVQIFTIIILALPGELPAQIPDAMHVEICDDLRKMEIELRDLEGVIRKRYMADTVFLAKFEQECTAWLAYSKARFDLKFPAANKKYEYGDQYPLCRCLEKIGIIRRRIEELLPWKLGEAAGNECPGSVLIE